jgi:hypothetical protein
MLLARRTVVVNGIFYEPDKHSPGGVNGHN